MKFLASLLFATLMMASTSHAVSLTISTKNFETFPNAFVKFGNNKVAMESVSFSLPSLFTPTRDGELKVALYGDFYEHGGQGNEHAAIEIDNIKLNDLGKYSPQLNYENADQKLLGGSNATWLFKTYIVPKDMLKSILEDGRVNFYARAGGNVDTGVSYFGASLSYSSVPEPTTLAILGLGAAATLAARRRKL
jgi:hypothetical protein